MSTRAVYTFKDQFGSFSVYKHYDGYPEGAALWIEKARALAWPGSRFEADEFAASFIAANKDKAGDVRITKSHSSHGDLSFRYEVTQKKGALYVQAFQRSYSQDETLKYTKIFSGSLTEFFAKYPLEQEAA